MAAQFARPIRAVFAHGAAGSSLCLAGKVSAVGLILVSCVNCRNLARSSRLFDVFSCESQPMPFAMCGEYSGVEQLKCMPGMLWYYADAVCDFSKTGCGDMLHGCPGRTARVGTKELCEQLRHRAHRSIYNRFPADISGLLERKFASGCCVMSGLCFLKHKACLWLAYCL